MRRENRIAELEYSLNRLNTQISNLNYDIWREEKRLAEIEIELENLKGQEDNEQIVAARESKLRFKSWFRSGASTEPQGESKRRAEASKAARIMVERKHEEVTAAIAALKSQDEPLKTRIMKEMRELARLTTEQEGITKNM